ncbi:MAG: mitochondrial fission ELM1 family protein [Planctomycetaceae bacterium]
MNREPITVWAIADGRPGHWNQVRGLIAALSQRVMVRDIAIPAPTRLYSMGELLRRRWRATDQYPAPDLIIGAGHATHLPMLIARASRGGRAIVLMKPSLPISAFDLCLIPDVQVKKSQSNVVATHGAVNCIRKNRSSGSLAGSAVPTLQAGNSFQVQRDHVSEPEVAARSDNFEGTILIGGPSRHVRWNSQDVLQQVFEVCTCSGDVRWHISTSRRTPDDFYDALHGLGLLNATIVDGRETGPDWLPNQLAQTDIAWVSSDSVSMVYESLTAGAKVGLLSVPIRQPFGKIGRNVRSLADRGDITLFEDWRESRTLSSPLTELNEADRCAEIILERFFRSNQAFAA